MKIAVTRRVISPFTLIGATTHKQRSKVIYAVMKPEILVTVIFGQAVAKPAISTELNVKLGMFLNIGSQKSVVRKLKIDAKRSITASANKLMVVVSLKPIARNTIMVRLLVTIPNAVIQILIRYM